MRPGRIDRKIYVPPPNLNARIQILKINLSKVPCAANVSIEELAAKVFSCSLNETSFIVIIFDFV
jgi:transitional endoplasmic reticulum ATPase